MLKPIKKASLVQATIDRLRQAIETGQWSLGEKLPVESDLAENLGVSRNTVREAVRVLAHGGMLETRQGDGTYVRATRDDGDALKRISASALADQLEVRTLLESGAAALAAERRTSQDLQAMADALDARARAGENIDQRVRHDEAFHVALVRSAHNAALSELYGVFSGAIAQTIRRTETDPDLPEPSQEDHELLLAAIRRGDAAKAKKLADKLLKPSLIKLRSGASGQ
ncbi:FadR/GntR family transcriptional regulator [Marinobacter sp. chi1]|uniref:FadR/GntR family transcriptional regulator n=1 Tax=Marinobacter suaedae TaxID=3057675 RepID=A0ABT8W1K2_9GAMM|nr:FadR/GntR family transcriptional regulator [Marinobacter sp. chi1]MDO3722109.1 FadR/GntR family transcriptional regulator [Marinobacter sp. chi1]